jgi:hypothetical protein
VPRITTLNQSDVPNEEPVFSKRELSQEAVAVFNRFVEKLHEATLELKKID